MKISLTRNFCIYTICTIAAIVILFGLNWVLRLPPIINVIGNEITWLPIVADAIISGIIFIGGNSYANADRLRNDITQKKNEFSLVSNTINRVINSFNIGRKQLSILYSIDISMNTPELIKEVLSIQQEIDEATLQFSQAKYLIKSSEEVAEFENCINIVSQSYHIVFDAMQKILSDWIATNSLSMEARTVADYTGSTTDKSDYSIKYVAHCSALEKEKDKFLKVYDQQKERQEYLFQSVRESGKSLLDKEYQQIQELESKL